ncbi:MAG: metal ABC transporter permease [Gammaproteobacteria bacterium]|nr:metal ABC transporter permease [Gammaproteobacteria bacterium]CAJ2376868.1 MAG: Zn(2(+)) ABC transporter membrane subunit [Arenicellales bacterium IbO2]MDA7971802.1 metal ABC transporter permease [Gammaproteobacteria bacterium]MDA7995977.1 metal ABC transporter permease [Gammaproteobacteria bacterium]MDA8006934.1 metal ABC transporter permease [Gammaproteobacteria bacterium]
MPDEFLIRAVLGGLGVALVCGPLGCLVVWQRMAFFGAALSHAALLGVALGLFLRVNLQLAILLVSLAVSALLMLMSRRRDIGVDTLLGILAHAALAFGLLLLTLLPGVRIDLAAYLFGDILAISRADLVWIFAGGCGALLALAAIWRPMLSLIAQRDLARIAGTDERRARALFLLLLSVTVAVSMQVVGILLIVSMLLIPAATARHFARSPESMALLAALFAALAVLGGIALSLWMDTPAGASIVAVGAAGFAAAAVCAGRRPSPPG